MPEQRSGALADATIVLDLDGTLVDSAPDLHRALNATLDLEGLAHLSLAKTRRFIGGGARRLIERAAGDSGVSFQTARLDALTDAFLEFYRADIASLSKPFPGATEALRELANQGAKLAVCTNKRTDLSLQLLEAVGLVDRFSAIVGSDAVAQRKPHPEHLQATIDRAGGAARRAIMVGDTAADVGAARGAGVRSIVVSFGYGEDAPASLGGDALIDSFEELAPTCAALLSAA